MNSLKQYQLMYDADDLYEEVDSDEENWIFTT